jgi:hypothetical protein
MSSGSKRHQLARACSNTCPFLEEEFRSLPISVAAKRPAIAPNVKLFLALNQLPAGFGFPESFDFAARNELKLAIAADVHDR